MKIIKPIYAQTLQNPFGIQPSNEPVSVLQNLISTVIGLLTVVAVIYFIFQIIIAGYNLISSEGDKAKVEAARKSLSYSIIGLVVVVVAVSLAALISSILGMSGILDLTSSPLFN